MNAAAALPLPLDPRSPLPLHAQAEETLRGLIKQPAYQKGALLPDEVSLARALGISRSTLRAAIARLVDEGRLDRKAGVGTRVIEPTVRFGASAWLSFTKEMAAKGVKVENYQQSARLTTLPPEASSALRVKEKSKALLVERVRGWEGRPVVHFLSYLHPRLELTSDLDFSQPLYELIQQHSGVIAQRSQEEVLAVSADARLASLLKVPRGAPLLRRVRVVFDTGQRPIEYGVVHYRCDRFVLTLNLSAGAS